MRKNILNLSPFSYLKSHVETAHSEGSPTSVANHSPYRAREESPKKRDFQFWNRKAIWDGWPPYILQTSTVVTARVLVSFGHGHFRSLILMTCALAYLPLLLDLASIYCGDSSQPCMEYNQHPFSLKEIIYP